MNIKLIISYDGTDFCGWQRQDKQRTVQGTLEAALEKMHKHPVTLYGAGRTDSGVHATGQCANFHTDIQSISPEHFVPALNSKLPPEVRVLSANAVPDSFHARFDARSRTYRYRIIAGRIALAHENPYCYCLRRVPDLAALNALARILHGELDCSLFASPRDKSLSNFRYIYKALFFMDRDILTLEITANAFLWKMVRAIVGTLLVCEEQGMNSRSFAKLLEKRDHKLCGPTAPPQGLFLTQVEYPVTKSF